MLAAFVAVVFGGSVVASCGGPTVVAAPVSFTPAAYGEQVQLAAGQVYYDATGVAHTLVQPQNSFVCYLVDTPFEVALLQQAGLCPNAWLPILMASITQGLRWHQQYAAFYDSPAYSDVYVPRPYRTVYVQHVHTFETTYRTQIDQAESTAKWKGTDGKPHSGQEVKGYIKNNQASFGSGSVRSTAFSSGSVRNSNAQPAATAPAKPKTGQSSQPTKPKTAQPAAQAARQQAPSRSVSGSGSFSTGSRSTGNGSKPTGGH